MTRTIHIGSAADGLRAGGVHVLRAAAARELTGADAADWARFGRNWDVLTPDRYMGDGGTYRMRRYGHFHYDVLTDDLVLQPHGTYHQDIEINALNGGVQRQFDPLTDEFRADPLTATLVRTLGQIFHEVEDVRRWDVKLHPFRIVTSAGQVGRPAPQGRHRDGGTYVTSLLIGRTNVTGGESSVYTDDGTEILSYQMSEPGDQILLDDRRVMHDVTPVHPIDPARPAHRDVLIIDFDVLSAF